MKNIYLLTYDGSVVNVEKSQKAINFRFASFMEKVAADALDCPQIYVIKCDDLLRLIS